MGPENCEKTTYNLLSQIRIIWLNFRAIFSSFVCSNAFALSNARFESKKLRLNVPLNCVISRFWKSQKDNHRKLLFFIWSMTSSTISVNSKFAFKSLQIRALNRVKSRRFIFNAKNFSVRLISKNFSMSVFDKSISCTQKRLSFFILGWSVITVSLLQ